MMNVRSRCASLGLCLLAGLVVSPCVAAAQAATSTPPAAAKPTPPPYSLPWQLRSVRPATALRADTIVGASTDPVTDGASTTAATFLALSFKLTPEFAAFLRGGFVVHSPAKGQTASPIINPALGGLYAFDVSPDVRLAFMAAVVLPIGQGGGNSPDPADGSALKAGIAARSGFDNPPHGVNDLTLVAGADAAYIAHGFTAQLELTLSQAFRVRGADVQKDTMKTNSGVGLHLGYFLIPELSFGGEIRMQRFLSTPKSVEANENLREQLTFAVGPRFHIHADDLWIRPGISYGRGIDKPMSAADYHLVQIDIPVAF